MTFYPMYAGCDYNFKFPMLQGGGSFTVEGDTAIFRYDVAGNLTQADNHHARVRRSYSRSGHLLTDTLRIRTVRYATEQHPGDPSGFNTHAFVLQYAYDSTLRRKTLTYPAQACAAACSVTYTYDDATTGALKQVTDVQGNVINFTYRLDRTLDSVAYPGGVKEGVEYDAEGRVVRRTVKLSGGYPVIDDTLQYDPLGRVLWGKTWAAPAYRYRTVWNYYAGLGALSAQEQAFDDGTDPKREEFRNDALGNRYYSEKRNFTTNTWNNPGRRETEYDDFGQLQETYSVTAAGQPDTLGYDEASMYIYDLAGNLRYRGYRLRGQGTSVVDFQQEANYYQADGKLRVFERHMGDLYQHSNDGPAFTTRGVHERYRYDALGRRVLVWTRRGPLCNDDGCESTVQRFVWDGNQIVYETRGPAADSVSPYQIESESPSGNGDQGQPNAYGEVSYTHAGGIDRPLAVYRTGGIGTFFPHANWRSFYDGATNTSGQVIPCEGAGVPCSDSPDLDWPGSATSAFIGATPEPRVTPAEWAGSLVMEQADASGLLYRRNRYYDPGSGRFTQPDPIGLAGGLNVYGFANGDPVTYSDPFGLWIVAEGLHANIAISNLFAGSATFRRIYMALLTAPKSKANITIRPARSVAERTMLKRLPECECAFAERDRNWESPDGRIIFNPSAAEEVSFLQTWFQHEIVHTAGQYSELTGVNPTCGKPEPASKACVDAMEAQIREEMRAYREEQAKEKPKEPNQ
jgi:RHS repeat-associated protein